VTTPLYRHNACVFKGPSYAISAPLVDQGCTPTLPSTLLPLKERARFTCCPEEIPPWDRITSCTLTEHDGARIDTYLGDTNRLGAALQLGAVRSLGCCPTDLQTASSAVTTFLARQRQVDPRALQDSGTRRMTRSTHVNAVLPHLGFRRVQPDDHEPIVAWLTERALEHDKPTLLFQMIGERLKQQPRMRPAVTTVARGVVTARRQAHPASLTR
jgi:hypothetical protein